MRPMLTMPKMMYMERGEQMWRSVAGSRALRQRQPPHAHRPQM